MNDLEQHLADALKPFGWTCAPEFWDRYYSDPWVFNLANAIERLTGELRDAERRSRPSTSATRVERSAT